jgi:hypothetical protein
LATLCACLTPCAHFWIYFGIEIGLGYRIFYAQLGDASHNSAATGATVADIEMAFTNVG